MKGPQGNSEIGENCDNKIGGGGKVPKIFSILVAYVKPPFRLFLTLFVSGYKL
jgi:hypothetical protein